MADDFDILIPLEMPSTASVVGESGHGRRGVNAEVEFRFGKWEASFHELEERRYIIVRLGLSERAIREAWPRLVEMLARASAALDISIRPAKGKFVKLGSGKIADLKNISLFPAGELPLIKFGDGSYSIGISVSALSEALDGACDSAKSEAFRVFTDVDFEASATSRFILLFTILELLAERMKRDPAALELIEKWRAEAKDARRGDIAEALAVMREESIGSAISRLVAAAAADAGFAEEELSALQKQTRNLYRKRGRLLHTGTSISIEELTSIRSIVRLVLVGDRDGTAFTRMRDKRSDDEFK